MDAGPVIYGPNTGFNALEQFTIKELLDEVIVRIDHQRARSRHAEVRREFSVAITAAEDAQMRYTRGRAIELGKFNPADLDKE